jgi:hypothetical protein
VREFDLAPITAIDDFVGALHLWRWHRHQRNQPHRLAQSGACSDDVILAGMVILRWASQNPHSQPDYDKNAAFSPLN